MSVVHIGRGRHNAVHDLDGKAAPNITSFLFHTGGDEPPKSLDASRGIAFMGSKIYGNGFLFDDHGSAASPLSLMNTLRANEQNRDRIRPYIGGEEINSSPTHAHSRYVINLHGLSEAEARQWPDLMAVVEAKVKPERDKLGDNTDARRRKANWWHWGQASKALFEAIASRKRVLACSRVQTHWCITFLDNSMVFSEAMAIFAIEKDAGFCSLQSRPHEIWARFFGSSMKDDLRDTPSDCFETFPFPPNWEHNEALEAAGKTYYEFRAALMIRNNEGLTKTYNRFHDPDESHPEILQLRDLHAAMDRAVLDAHGWTDIQPTCEFLLDYEDDEDEEESAGKRRKKKPWRYRWSDEIRDEVLARLLDLNAKRAKEEAAPVAKPITSEQTPPPKKRAPRAKKGAATNADQGDLFGKKGE